MCKQKHDLMITSDEDRVSIDKLIELKAVEDWDSWYSYNAGRKETLLTIDDYPTGIPWDTHEEAYALKFINSKCINEEKKEPMLNTNILLKIDIAVTLILIAVLVFV